MSGGIEGKWKALNDERDQLKEQVQALESRLGACDAELVRLQRAVGHETVDLLAQIADLKQQLLRAVVGRRADADDLTLDEDEQRVMDQILGAYGTITRQWRLKANAGELTSAVHVVQGFVMQHMLSRLSPDWGSWWDDEDSVIGLRRRMMKLSRLAQGRQFTAEEAREFAEVQQKLAAIGVENENENEKGTVQ